MLSKALDPHFRKPNLSLFRRNSSSIFACTAFSVFATSTWTEWSMTRSTGTCIRCIHMLSLSVEIKGVLTNIKNKK